MTAIGKQFYRVIVIGDLPEHEAKQFLIIALLKASSHSNALCGIQASVSNETWKRIYEVTLMLYNTTHYTTLHGCIAV
jgi:hypothetical protein